MSVALQEGAVVALFSGEGFLRGHVRADKIAAGIEVEETGEG